MKKIVFIFSVIFFFGCSNFEDKYDLDALNLDYNSLSPELMETDLPVINITVDSDEFQNMFERVEEEIEIDGYFRMYRNQELVIHDEEVEIELKGNFSKQFELKSLGIKFEDKYDNSNRKLINPPVILPHHNLDEIKSIRLRNSGNDFKRTMLKDLSYTQLAIQTGMDLDLTYGEQSIVFVNEKFYGLLNLRTESNAHGVAGLHNSKKSEVTLGKMETQTLIKKDGDFERIDNLVEAVTRKDLDYLKNEIDVDNFIDYVFFQTYISNTDWPQSNAKFYAIEDSKFRFVIFDLDSANRFALERSPILLIDKNKKNFVSDLFLVLYEDSNFRSQFWERYQYVLSQNLMSKDTFKSFVYSNLEAIKIEMQFNIQKYTLLESKTEWLIAVDRMVQMFEERDDKIEDIVMQEIEE